MNPFLALPCLGAAIAAGTVHGSDYLESMFGNGGYAYSSIATDGSVFPSKPVVQDDGKVLVCATTAPSYSIGQYLGAHLAVFRFTQNGTVDTSFGTDGRVIIDFTGDHGYDACNDIAIDTKGRIVLLGSSRLEGNSLFAIARLERDGSLDATFGNRHGTTLLRLKAEGDEGVAAKRLFVQGDGKLLLAGIIAGEGPIAEFFVVARLEADGRLDPDFADQGRLLLHITAGASDPAHLDEIAAFADGSFIVAGGGPQLLTAIHITREGRIDESFGDFGRATIPIDTAGFTAEMSVDAMAIQADGRIMLGGRQSSFCGLGPDATLVRLLSDGRIDRSFGEEGKVSINGHCTAVHSIIPRTDARILLALSGEDSEPYFPGATTSFHLIEEDGTIDMSFDVAGQQHIAPDMVVNGSFIYVSGNDLQQNHAASFVARIESPALIPAHSSHARPHLVPPEPGISTNRLRQETATSP